VHLPSTLPNSLLGASQLRPGNPAAPGRCYLPLLPLGPDGVHSFPPRRTRPSTPLGPSSPTRQGPQAGIRPCC